MVSSPFLPLVVSQSSNHVSSLESTGGSGYPPQPGQDQPSQGASSAVDGAEPLFSMYVDMTAEQDNKMAKSWKGDADGILVFVSPDTTLCSSCVNFQHFRLVFSLLLLQH